MTRWHKPDPYNMQAVRDSLRQQIAFLQMERCPAFTEDARIAMYECAEQLGRATRQMDAGQKGKGMTFDDAMHVMVRMCVAACILAWSGKLEEVMVDE